MLFNSVEYLFIFLPLAVLGYYLAGLTRSRTLVNAWCVLASLFFYSWWRPENITVILVSILMNHFLGRELGRKKNKRLLVAGIAANLLLLFYYKYIDFFILNVNLATGAGIRPLDIVLPLAISFFTFQQIAFLVDCHRGGAKEHSFLEYILFVAFFPQLIAGPIVRHNEMMPQFQKEGAARPNLENIAKGLFILSVGLFKKVVIADTFATWASAGFGGNFLPTFFDAWGISLSYTFQIYFDFSGYTDMAIGSALMFNILLPVNFNSPYKALNIQDFWRRWHITLSHWLREHVYIPLGGSRGGRWATALNLFLTFLIGGIWHGAGWTFVVWGALHGIALVAHRFWKNAGYRLNRYVSWACTFLFVNAAWVFFRAESLKDAARILRGMAMFNGVALPARLGAILGVSGSLPEVPFVTGLTTYLFILAMGLVAVAMPNSMELIGFNCAEPEKCLFQRKVPAAVLTGLAAGIASLFLVITTGSEFLYFNF